MKKRYIITIIFCLSIILFHKLDVYAADIKNTEVSGSSCGSTTQAVLNLTVNSDNDSTCHLQNDEDSSGGMYTCAQEAWSVYAGGFYPLEKQENKKRMIAYMYDDGRIDTWANNSKGWNTNAALGISTCPEMRLNFTTERSINTTYLQGLKNVKIKSIKVIDWENSNHSSFLNSYVAKKFQTYSIKNLKIESLSDGLAITDDNGKVINTKIKYKIKIDKLMTNAGDGLGYNGTNKWLCGYENGICTKNARALHYYTPVYIELEYDNPDPPEPDPCEETVNGKTPQQYAYENGKCCEYYPEACCANTEYILSIKNSMPSVYEFCCTDTTESIYYGNSLASGLPKLYTFRHYFIYPGELDSLCPTCTEEEDYFTYTSDGEVKQSKCCLTGMYRSKYSERCKLPTCSATNNQCGNDEYFDENRDCCCDINSRDDRCTTNVWDNEDASCAIAPISVDSNFNEGVVASGEEITTEGKTYENIAFTKYDGLDKMKSNIIKSGTGFNYDISVRHQVKKIAKTNYSYCSGGSGSTYSSAYNRALSEINDFLEIDENKINDAADEFKLNSNIKDEYFILDGNISHKTPTTNNIWINITYKVPKTCSYRVDGITYYYDCSYCTTTTVSMPAEKTYTYTYNLKLREQYIAKQDASLAVHYTQVTEDDPSNIQTINTTTPIDYINGGNKYYTEVTTSTGIYDFYVKLDDDHALGVTGNLKNYNDGFDCQFGVVNQIRKNGKFDCGISGNLPCDDEITTNSGRGFYFRQISLSDPFPNGRNIGKNWNSYCSSGNNCSYINKSGLNDSFGSVGDNKGNNVYNEEPMYQITLDSNLIGQIKRYNKDNDYDYGWRGMTNKVYNELDSTSDFIDRFSSFINVNTIRDDKVGDF